MTQVLHSLLRNIHDQFAISSHMMGNEKKRLLNPSVTISYPLCDGLAAHISDSRGVLCVFILRALVTVVLKNGESSLVAKAYFLLRICC